MRRSAHACESVWVGYAVPSSVIHDQGRDDPGDVLWLSTSATTRTPYRVYRTACNHATALPTDGPTHVRDAHVRSWVHIPSPWTCVRAYVADSTTTATASHTHIRAATTERRVARHRDMSFPPMGGVGYPQRQPTPTAHGYDAAYSSCNDDDGRNRRSRLRRPFERPVTRVLAHTRRRCVCVSACVVCVVQMYSQACPHKYVCLGTNEYRHTYTCVSAHTHTTTHMSHPCGVGWKWGSSHVMLNHLCHACYIGC